MELADQEQEQILEELQLCHDEREAALRHIKSVKAENEELKRQLHYIYPGGMETTGIQNK